MWCSPSNTVNIGATLRKCLTPQYQILSDATTQFFNKTIELVKLLKLISIAESARTKSNHITSSSHYKTYNLLGSLSQSILKASLKAGHEYTSRMRNNKYILPTPFHILAFVETSLRTTPLKKYIAFIILLL